MIELLPEGLNVAFLCRFSGGPTHHQEKVNEGKCLSWEHWLDVVTAWHLQVRHSMGNNGLGFTDSLGKTGQHSTCN